MNSIITFLLGLGLAITQLALGFEAMTQDRSAWTILPQQFPTLIAGEEQQLFVKGTNEQGNSAIINHQLAWMSSNSNVAHVSATGLITAGEIAGNAIITASGLGKELQIRVSNVGQGFSLHFYQPQPWLPNPIHIWLWDERDGVLINFLSDQWPGVAMERDLRSGGLWFRTALNSELIDNRDNLSVIFNCGNNQCQTQNHRISSGSNLWLHGNSWSTTAPIPEPSITGTQVQIGNGGIYLEGNSKNLSGKLFQTGTILHVKAKPSGKGLRFLNWEGTGVGLLLDPNEAETQLIVDDQRSITLLAVYEAIEDPYMDGRQNFQRLCAACHGLKGDGGIPFVAIKERYSLASLTSYISNYMPKGQANVCVGNCASNIAGMILGDGFEAPSGACNPQSLEDLLPEPRRLVLLSNVEYENTIAKLLQLPNFKIPAGLLPPDLPFNGFKTDASKIFVKNHGKAYLQVAEYALTAVGSILSLRPECTTIDCFIRSFSLEAFRRPILEAEFNIYKKLYELGGIREMTIAILSSPATLYRSEMGRMLPSGAAKGYFQLSDFEIASLLSYTFWASPPDRELIDAAMKGRLTDPLEIKKQASRLLNSPEARPAMKRFILGWLDLDRPIHGDIDAQLKEDMKQEALQFVESILFAGGTYEALLLATTSPMTQRLARHYGISWPGGNDWQEVSMLGSPGERRGILGKAAILTTQASSETTHPIKRGLFIRRQLLCQDFPPPPIGAELKPVSDPSLTVKERFEAHIKPDCKVCHQHIDGIGFGLEGFDHLGQFREFETTPDGTVKQLDILGSIGSLNSAETFLRADAPVETFHEMGDLANLIAQSRNGKACFVRQWYRYSRGFREDDSSSCTLDTMGKPFKLGASNMSMIDMILASTQLKNYILRR